MNCLSSGNQYCLFNFTSAIPNFKLIIGKILIVSNLKLRFLVPCRGYQLLILPDKIIRRSFVAFIFSHSDLHNNKSSYLIL